MTSADPLSPAVLEPGVPDIRALAALPPGFAATRASLHALADQVIAPARVAIDGDFRLQWLPGGFGTPRIGVDQQIRVDGAELVVAGNGACRRQAITSCRDAAGFVGAPRAGRRDLELSVDPVAARWLGDFYGFALAVLTELRAAAGGEEPTLWPEHFDYAIVSGDEAAGTQANYGFSPGDEHHDEPYLYVGPFESREGELWNAVGFSGAQLLLGDLLGTPDHRAAARAFFETHRSALATA